ncbi:phage holin family protein [Dactylosporangium sp. CS-047395]|uniref:phage holin family protein n=1 Tax=Dactylosporangium sp. CS-047395 TaxID=3239936 RepID=UPI003D931F2A
MTSDLVVRVAAQISTVTRAELSFAKAELTEKGRRGGFGAGLSGRPAALAIYGFQILVVVTLDLLWLAVLAVAVSVFSVAGIAALFGRRQLQAVGSPMPQEALTSLNQDVDVVRTAAREGRTS